MEPPPRRPTHGHCGGHDDRSRTSREPRSRRARGGAKGSPLRETRSRAGPRSVSRGGARSRRRGPARVARRSHRASRHRSRSGPSRSRAARDRERRTRSARRAGGCSGRGARPPREAAPGRATHSSESLSERSAAKSLEELAESGAHHADDLAGHEEREQRGPRRPRRPRRRRKDRTFPSLEVGHRRRAAGPAPSELQPTPGSGRRGSASARPPWSRRRRSPLRPAGSAGWADRRPPSGVRKPSALRASGRTRSLAIRPATAAVVVVSRATSARSVGTEAPIELAATTPNTPDAKGSAASDVPPESSPHSREWELSSRAASADRSSPRSSPIPTSASAWQ